MTRSRTSTDDPRPVPVVVKALPGVFGALLVCAGLAFVYWPASVVVAGVFLLMLDRRL